MIIHNGYENLNLVSPVVTMGIFDGVHRGHKTLLASLIKKARQAKGESVVITFSPHPRLVLEKNDSNLSFLTTMDEKKILLENEGIDHLIVLHFTKQFSKIHACDFVKDILVEKIGTKHLLIGYNHHFGSKGEGDFNTIVQCSESLGFKVEQLPVFQTGEGAVSSSLIRNALAEGRIDIANKMLGYSYALSGNVIQGRQIGRSLGFPTANIKPDDQYKLIPSGGVYAVEVNIEGNEFPGMLSIGSNPTVNNDYSAISIEVNILNFDRDIYGKNITVRFIKRLRDEKKFKTTAQLAEQMERDKQETLRLSKEK